MRQTFVQVKIDGEYKLVPKGEHHHHINAPFVMGDISPYKSVLDGSIISSRSHHRAHMKQHNVIEVGNEWTEPKKKKDNRAQEIRQDIANQLYR